jgi:hypothetical protein
MSTTLNTTGITFGDGTTQATKTPTVISAFTNDSNYVTSSTASSTYATPAQTATYFGFDTGYSVTIILNNINGTGIYGGFYNCNCNC